MKRYFVEIYEEETDAYLLQTKYYNSVEECREFIRQISYFMLECYHMAIMVAEGKVLHHCVSSYQEAFASKHTTILFFRRNNNLSEPYFTIELAQNDSIDNKFSIRQVHGSCNSNPNAEIVQALLQWAAETGNVDETSIHSQYGALCCRG